MDVSLVWLSAPIITTFSVKGSAKTQIGRPLHLVRSQSIVRRLKILTDNISRSPEYIGKTDKEREGRERQTDRGTEREYRVGGRGREEDRQREA